MTRAEHSRWVGAGFTLAYVAAMSAMFLHQAERLGPWTQAAMAWVCLPAFVLGVLVMVIAHLRPLRNEPPA